MQLARAWAQSLCHRPGTWPYASEPGAAKKYIMGGHTVKENQAKKKSLYCRYEPSGRDSFGPLTHAVTHHKKRGAPTASFVFGQRVSSPDGLHIRSHGQQGSDMSPHSAAVSVLHIEAAFVHIKTRLQ